MKELKVFINSKDFAKWRVEDYKEAPYLIVDYERMILHAGVSTKCKDWETAADRFRKALEGKTDTIDDWFDDHYECIIDTFIKTYNKVDIIDADNESLSKTTNKYHFAIQKFRFDIDTWHVTLVI